MAALMFKTNQGGQHLLSEREVMGSIPSREQPKDVRAVLGFQHLQGSTKTATFPHSPVPLPPKVVHIDILLQTQIGWPNELSAGFHFGRSWEFEYLHSNPGRVKPMS